MTNRERWIVYPLLFFALSLGFKANYRTAVEYDSIDVERITVKQINGRPATSMTTSRPFDLDVIRDAIRSTLDALPTEASADESQDSTSAESETSEEGDQAEPPDAQASDSQTTDSQTIEAEEVTEPAAGESPTDPSDAGESAADANQ